MGDIDIAYKQFGNGSSNDIPIVLIAGGGVTWIGGVQLC